MRVVRSPSCAPWESNDGAEHLGSLDGAEQLFHELAPRVARDGEAPRSVPHSLYRAPGATIRRQRPPFRWPIPGRYPQSCALSQGGPEPKCRGLVCSIGDARRCRLTTLCPVYRGQAETVVVTTKAADSWIVKRHRAFRPIAVNLANDVRWLGRLLVRVQSGEQTRRSQACGSDLPCFVTIL
jgi:hypothetical protein